VPTNVDFLVNCAKHPVFQQAGAANTGFLEDYFEDVQVVGTTMMTEGDEDEDTAAVSTPSNPLATAVGVFASLLHSSTRCGLSVSAPFRDIWTKLLRRAA
jgi:hypothetical protein